MAHSYAPGGADIKKMSHSKVACSTSPQLVNATERRTRVLELRREKCWTTREIASHIIEEFGEERVPKGYDCRYVWRDLRHELDALIEDGLFNTLAFVAEEKLRLDEMEARVWRQAFPESGEVHNPSVSILLRIMDRRAKLLGLDQARKVAHTHVHVDAASEEARLEALRNILPRLQQEVGDAGLIALKRLGVQEVAMVDAEPQRERTRVEGRGDQASD